MTTLGDVWSITAAICGIAACTWALLVCASLLFERRTAAAKEHLLRAPVQLTLLGLGVTVLVGGAGIAMLSLPNPLVKFLGWAVMLWLMVVSFTGSAGLARYAGERVNRLDPNLSPYGALSRGAMFVVLSSLLPILGWLVFAPIIFCLGVGSGLRVMRLKERTPEPARVE